MNSYAHKTTAALYAAAAAAKRNPCQDRQQGLCKNNELSLHAGRKKVLPVSHNARSSVDAVIKHFNGAIVTGYAPAVEWGIADFSL